MSIDTRNLRGARASSAVICAARAEYEGLGFDRTDETPAYLERAFARGKKVGVLWARILRDDLIATGRDPAELIVEDECPWGPPEYGYVGHADLTDYGEKIVHEIYHAKGGAYREHKGWQAAWYAISKGPEWRAQVDVIDTTKDELESDDEGFSIQSYDVNPAGLRQHILELQARVVTAVALGEVNPADKVSQSPHHAECRSCAFMSTCHAGWRPTPPDEVPGLEADFDALRILQADLAGAEAKVSEIKRMRDEKRDGVREYLQPGVPVLSGDTVIKVIEVKGRTTVSLTDYQKAGHEIPAELEAFVKHGKPSERWFVDQAKP